MGVGVGVGCWVFGGGGNDGRYMLICYNILLLQVDEGSYVRSYDGGVRIETHNAQGYVPTKIASFLMNLHVQGKPVFIRSVFIMIAGWLI